MITAVRGVRPFGLLGPLVLAALMVSACSSSGQTAHASASSRASSASPSMAAKSAAVSAYRGMWGAFVAAAKTSNPDAPDLRRYAEGDALRLIVSDLYTNRDQSKVTLGTVGLDPTATAAQPAAAPTSVTVADCVNDEKWLLYRKSGGLVDNVPGGRHRTTATVKLSGGVWRVDAFTLEDSGTC
jgi:hypothetical protein